MPLPETPQLLLFLAAATVLIVIPGPAVFYIAARSVAQGPLAGLVSALGVGAGAAVHVCSAAPGVSAVVMASGSAFTLLERDRTPAGRVAPPRRLRRVFLDGAVVNVLNPKVALFFLAFLPQFVEPAAGRVPLQIMVLGALFVIVGIVRDGAYALAAGTLAARLRRSARAARVSRWLSGGVYLGLGPSLAVASPGDGPRD